MLYIFNSGTKPLYRTNMMNTLYLPSGCSNEYRYGERNLDRHICDQPDIIPIGEQCLFIFIDRYHVGSYQFIPVREGHLIKRAKADDQVIFTLKLDKYLFSSNLVEFGNQLSKMITIDDLPHLVNGDPDNTNDGKYAIYMPKQSLSSLSLEISDSSWFRTVELVSRSKVFTEYEKPVFIRCEVTDFKDKTLSFDSSSYIKLKRSSHYIVRFHYRQPNTQPKDLKTTRVSIESTDNLSWGLNKYLLIDSNNNTVTNDFYTTPYPDDCPDSFILSIEDTGYLIPSSPVNIKVLRPRFIVILVAVILWALASCITTLTPIIVLKLILSMSQAVILLFLFIYVGKKPF